MTEIDRGESPVEMVVLFLEGKIKEGDITEDNLVKLKYYLALREDDQKFGALVAARRSELSKGRKTELFSQEDLEKASRHRGRLKKPDELYRQPGLWKEETGSIYSHDAVIDPMRRLEKSHQRVNGEDVRNNINKLRDELGLKTARGKDPHVKDKFYQKIVDEYIGRDVSGVFNEYDKDRTSDRFEELKVRVKGQVQELLDPGLSRNEKYRRLKEMVQEWGEQEIF